MLFPACPLVRYFALNQEAPMARAALHSLVFLVAEFVFVCR